MIFFRKQNRDRKFKASRSRSPKDYKRKSDKIQNKTLHDQKEKEVVNKNNTNASKNKIKEIQKEKSKNEEKVKVDSKEIQNKDNKKSLDHKDKRYFLLTFVCKYKSFFCL